MIGLAFMPGRPLAKHELYTMTLQEFKNSLPLNSPPAGLSPLAEALWFDARGKWHEAHAIVQDIETAEGSWIHAYLHRKEGDEGNARYWYARAGKKFPKLTLEEEWSELVAYFLNH